MKLGKLTKNTDILDFCADPDSHFGGITSDSNSVKPGDVFIAVKGYKTDGHKYIEDAVNRGAVCIVCQTTPEIDTPYIRVADTRKAMSLMAAEFYDNPAGKMKIIGVTGTNGKTTVTYLIKHIIETCTGCKTGLIGTISNLIGDKETAATHTTPDCCQLQKLLSDMYNEGCEYAVMEVSSHALSLHRVYGITFDIGVFTNLTSEHLDFHKSIEDYAMAKAVLFSQSSTGIINADDKFAGLMAQHCKGKVIKYGKDNENADVRATDIELYPDRTGFQFSADGVNRCTVINIPGMFSVYNAIAAIATGIELGFNKEDIVKAISICKGVSGRAEIQKTDSDFTVLIDYAHTPDALENIIKTARAVSKGRVHTLFGCGGDRDKTKRPVMGKLATELSDITIITSDNPRTEEPGRIIEDILSGIADSAALVKEGKLKVLENRRDAILEALCGMAAEDILIIAGKGHERYQIIGTEKIDFDDRDIVEEYFANKDLEGFNK